MKLLYHLWVGVLVSLIFSTESALALDLTLGLKAEARVVAGLDYQTREMIERMPAEIREQTIQMLVEALPLIDKSVNEYLDRVDTIVSNQLVAAGCAIQGTAKGTLDIFGSALKSENSPRPVADLSKQWDELQIYFTKTSTPKDYVIAYADYLANASVTACQVASSDLAMQTVKDLQSDARNRWQAWRRLDGTCDTAEGCFDKSFEIAGDHIHRADARDLDRSDAKRMYSAVEKPPAQSWFSDFKQEPYERQIILLQRVVDAIELSRVERASSALKMIGAVSDKIDNHLRVLRQASEKAASRQALLYINCRQAVRRRIYPMDAAVDLLKKPLAEAISISADAALEANRQLERIETVHAEIRTIQQKILNLPRPDIYNQPQCPE